MSLLSFFVTVLVLVIGCGVVYWAIQAIAAAFGLTQPIVTLLNVLLVLVTVFYLLGVLVGYAPPIRLSGVRF